MDHGARFALPQLNRDSKNHEEIPLREQVEILTLAGDVALHEARPKIHAHMVAGKRDGSAHGRHLRLPLIDIEASGQD